MTPEGTPIYYLFQSSKNCLVQMFALFQSWMISIFSSLRSLALSVQLNEPAIVTWLSIIPYLRCKVTGDRYVSHIWMMFDVGCMREDVWWLMDDVWCYSTPSEDGWWLMEDVYKMDDVWWMMDDVIPRHLTFYIYEFTPSPTPHNQRKLIYTVYRSNNCFGEADLSNRGTP